MNYREVSLLEINPNILELIVSKLNNETIQSLSLVPGVWNEISLFANKQHFWYLRTQELMERDLSWREGCWREAYYILSSFREIHPHMFYDADRNCTLAVDILLSLGCAPLKESLRIASRRGQSGVVRLLLQDGREDPSYKENDALKGASINGHAEVVKLLLADKRVNPSCCRQDIPYVFMNRHIDVVRLLLQDERIDLSMWCEVFGATYEYPDIIALFLEDKRISNHPLMKPELEKVLNRARREGNTKIIKLIEDRMSSL